MRCRECEERLGELVAGELGSATAAAVTAHLEECAPCRRALEETEATIRLLRRAGAVALPDGFGVELRQRLVAAGPPELPGTLARLRRWTGLRPLAWATVGAAAAALLALGATRLRAPAPAAPTASATPHAEVAAGPVAPTYRVPAARLAVVKIDFVADEPVDDVAFAVALPDGLRFVSGGRELLEREFSWHGPLVEGSNPIPFTVRGARAGRYTIRARAVGGGVDATHEVVLEVTKG